MFRSCIDGHIKIFSIGTGTGAAMIIGGGTVTTLFSTNTGAVESTAVTALFSTTASIGLSAVGSAAGSTDGVAVLLSVSLFESEKKNYTKQKFIRYVEKVISLHILWYAYFYGLK